MWRLCSNDLHQTLVHRTDEGTGGAGREDSANIKGKVCRMSCCCRPRKTVFPTAIWPDSGRAGGGDPRTAAGPGLGTELGGRAGQRCGKRGLLLFHLQCPGYRWASAAGERSWCWAAAPTASARALNLTTAASMRPLPCAMKASNPSWSTAIRKPFPPITTPRTSSILSR